MVCGKPLKPQEEIIEMKNSDFNTWLVLAKKENIVDSDIFNSAGYFWINLTDRQLKTMYNLMKSQGAKENEHGISLINGLRINIPK